MDVTAVKSDVRHGRARFRDNLPDQGSGRAWRVKNTLSMMQVTIVSDTRLQLSAITLMLVSISHLFQNSEFTRLPP